jgi:tetratricopeptide (TPR) repeat protein
MTMQTNANNYQKALQLAEAGSYQEALSCIEQHLQTTPEDGEALNDAGVILHCLGRSDEAVERLARARDIQGNSAEVLWNLTEALLAEGRAKEAKELFHDMHQLGILNPDVLNRTANLFLGQQNKADAIEVLDESLQLWLQQQVLEPMIEVIRLQRPKIGFVCPRQEDAKFAAEVHKYIERRFPVRLLEDQSSEQLADLVQWSDVCWLEGCGDLTTEVSRMPKAGKNVLRVNLSEADSPWLKEVEWHNIDVLIMAGSPRVKDLILAQIPNLQSRTQLVTIPYGIDLDEFTFTHKPRGKNLACLGDLDMSKNSMFLLQCMQKLHYIDSEYKLFFAGAFESPMLRQSIEHMVQALNLVDVVFFEGRQQDINAWLQEKQYIVSGNVTESPDMGVLEGMACGLKPVIHNFPGADDLLPSEFLFNISEEFCEQVLSDEYEPQRYREFVESNYPLKQQLNRISDILTHIEAELEMDEATMPASPAAPAWMPNSHEAKRFGDI